MNQLLSLIKGEVLALVARSGCGKSVSESSISGLVKAPRRIGMRGQHRFRGRELVVEMAAKDYRTHPRQPVSHDLPGADVAFDPLYNRGNISC